MVLMIHWMYFQMRVQTHQVVRRDEKGVPESALWPTAEAYDEACGIPLSATGLPGECSDTDNDLTDSEQVNDGADLIELLGTSVSKCMPRLKSRISKTAQRPGSRAAQKSKERQEVSKKIKDKRQEFLAQA